MDQPIRITIDPDQAGARIDLTLARAIGTMSRTRVKGLIEEGFVTRDGARISEPAEPARLGATYLLTPPDPVAAIPLPQPIPIPITSVTNPRILALPIIHPAN